MTKTIDEILNDNFEQEERERAERKVVLSDPFKRPRTEPGRALPNHGHITKRRPSASLGGRHS
ncbi:MAG: hypothetical protein JWM85_334 [Acidimicrobiaceae bacterium]|nr:hypothetical protein [Acidimicrobiaceae bacterium]